MGIFKFDNYNLTLSRVEISAIPEFAEVLRKDRGSEGDSDGRKKYRAFAEFMYIFLMYSPDSPHYKLPEDIRKEKAIKDAKLPTNWKPDRDVRAAVKKYQEIEVNLSPNNRVLVALERGMNLSSAIIDSLVADMERKLVAAEKANNVPVPEGMSPPSIDISPLVTQLNTLIVLSDKIPGSIKNIEIIREKVLREKAADISKVKRGGEQKGNREHPKYMDGKFKEDAESQDT